MHNLVDHTETHLYDCMCQHGINVHVFVHSLCRQFSGQIQPKVDDHDMHAMQYRYVASTRPDSLNQFYKVEVISFMHLVTTLVLQNIES